MNRLRQFLLSPPDEVIAEMAAGGERYAAYTRLVIVVVIWVLAFIVTLIYADTRPEFMPVLIGCTMMLVFACLYVYCVNAKVLVSISPFLISISDVTFVSCTLFAMALLNMPEMAVNNMVIWEGYLLFILASCLYYDVRVCLLTSLAAIIQYALILAWCIYKFDFPVYNPDAATFTGLISYVQLSRFFLLIVATAIAIIIILRSRRLLKLSGTDTLTGLPNRRIIEAHLSQEISRSKRHNLSFTVVYLDLDHFKNFNSKWGHATGDKVLKLVAQAMQLEKRNEDTIHYI